MILVRFFEKMECMRTTKLIFGTALLFMFAPGLILAETDVRAEKREQFRKEMQQQRQEAIDRLRVRKDSITNQLKGGKESLQKDLQNKTEELKQNFAADREKFNKDKEARRAALKKQLGEKRAATVDSFFTDMLGKFDSTADQLDEFSHRIDDNLNKAASGGNDVTEERGKLEIAEEKISDAQKALGDVRAKYTDAVRQKNFKNAFSQTQNAVKGITDIFKDAQLKLLNIVSPAADIARSSVATSTSTTR